MDIGFILIAGSFFSVLLWAASVGDQVAKLQAFTNAFHKKDPEGYEAFFKRTTPMHKYWSWRYNLEELTTQKQISYWFYSWLGVLSPLVNQSGTYSNIRLVKKELAKVSQFADPELQELAIRWKRSYRKVRVFTALLLLFMLGLLAKYVFHIVP